MLIYAVVTVGLVFAAYAVINMRKGTKEQHPLSDEQEAKVLYDSAWRKLSQQKYKDALRDADEAMNYLPDDKRLHWLRASIYLGMKQYDEAILDCDFIIQRDKTYHWAYQARGQAYDSLGKLGEAIADYDQSIELNPSAFTYNLRAWTKALIGDYQGSLADAEKAIELEPETAHIIDTRGQAKWLLGDYEGALADYQKAAQLDSNFVIYHIGRAAALYKLNRQDEAIAEWQQLANFEDEAQTADELQEKYRFAEPFYQALKDIEALAKG